jgi:hypothetical protein
MGKERGELAACFASSAGHERNKLSVKPCFTNEQTGGNGDAYPAIFEDVDGETRTAGSKFTIDAQVVVHAGEGGFDRRRFGVALEGKGPDAKSAIFLDGEDNPAGGMGGSLSARTDRRNEEQGEQ